MSCWWAEGQGGWRWWGEMEMRSRFWGKSVEMAPVGQVCLVQPLVSGFQTVVTLQSNLLLDEPT